MQKEKIIDSYYKIFCTCTRQSKDEKIPDNDYFKRRLLGFKAELEFEKLIKADFKEYKFLEGGQFLSEPINTKKISSGLFIYTTFDYLPPQQYINIYKKISNWSNVRDLIYIQIIKEGWDSENIQVKQNIGDKELSTTTILSPKYLFFRFDKEKSMFFQDNTITFSSIIKNFNAHKKTPSTSPLRSRERFDYLLDYELDLLMKIYATRYFMDYKKREKVHLNFLDLDGFLIKEDDDIRLFEIKEKAPIKTKGKGKNVLDEKDWSYGWDIRRLLWYVHLGNQTGLPIIYAVRQIKERYEREFVQWDAIYIDNFLQAVGWSAEVGGGGGSGTLQAPYLHFQRLDEII